MPEPNLQELEKAMNEAKAAFHEARDTAMRLSKACHTEDNGSMGPSEANIKEQRAMMQAEIACVEKHTTYLKAETAYYDDKRPKSLPEQPNNPPK